VNEQTPAEAPDPADSRNGLATAAFVLGLLSLVVNPFLVPSILAVVYAVRGLRKSRRIGMGRGLAIAGLVLGLAGAVALVTFIAFEAPRYLA
jgi:hypothetical protein